MRKLNFGCGENIKEGYVNLDITSFKEVDKTFDFNVFLHSFSDSEFDVILVDNVLEHLDDVPAVMRELHE